METQTATAITPEMADLKQRLKATWEAGDYGYFARYLEPGARDFLAGIDIPNGSRVLDVACGAGQLSIPAALAGAEVRGVDIAGNLIAQARARAEKAALDIHFDEGDAEALPYREATFDRVVSLFGAMFAPRPDPVAAELLRVCRPGGRIVMGNWTPEGFVGEMFKIIAKHVPPSPLMEPPVKWGKEAVVRERLAAGTSELKLQRVLYPLEYPFPPAEVVQLFRTYYGPINRAFASLDAAGAEALRHDLEQLWTTHNQGGDGRTHCDSEYLVVSAVRSAD